MGTKAILKPIATPATLDVDLEAGLLTCHANHKAPGHDVREKYLGASEIGDCARKMVFQRLNGHNPSAASAAAMSTGSYLEPQAVAIIKAGAKDWSITRTCIDEAGQEEAFAVGAPLFSHPDGIVETADGMVGVIDIKRPYTATVKAAKAGDIWGGYLDQIQVQIGTMRESGSVAPTFGVLFFMDKSNPLHSHMEVIPWDEGNYSILKARARAIMPYILAGELPDAEPTRGHCSYCPLKHDCPAKNGMSEQASTANPKLSLAAEMEIEEILEKLGPLEKVVDPLNDQIEGLKKDLKAAVEKTGIDELICAGAKVKMIRGTRSDLDKKGLAAEAPDLVAKFTKSNPTLTMRVSYL